MVSPGFSYFQGNRVRKKFVGFFEGIVRRAEAVESILFDLI
jgi:hypothetical protein